MIQKAYNQVRFGRYLVTPPVIHCVFLVLLLFWVQLRVSGELFLILFGVKSHIFVSASLYVHIRCCCVVLYFMCNAQAQFMFPGDLSATFYL